MTTPTTLGRRRSTPADATLTVRRSSALARATGEGAVRSRTQAAVALVVVLARLLGVHLHEEFIFEIQHQRYLVLHGDQFDPTLDGVFMSEMAGYCYGLSKKINKKLAKWLKKKTKKWSRVLECIKTGLIGHARTKGFDGVVTGHTHFADDAHVGDTHYLNSGCWTEPPCSFLHVESGRMTLHQLPD